MTSYSDNANDITNLFCCFEKFLAYTLFLTSFIVVRHQMVELNWGGGFFAPPSVLGVSRTLSKIGLKNKFQMIKLFSHSFYTITGIYHEQSAILPMCEPGCPKNRNSRKNPSIGKFEFLRQMGTSAVHNCRNATIHICYLLLTGLI